MPSLQQINSARDNLVRNINNDRSVHILEQRALIFGVLRRRELPFASEPAHSRNNLR